MILVQSTPIRKTRTPVALASCNSVSGSDQNLSLSSLKVIHHSTFLPKSTISPFYTKKNFLIPRNKLFYSKIKTCERYIDKKELISRYSLTTIQHVKFKLQNTEQGLRVWNVVPSSYFMMTFFRCCRLFLFCIFLESPDHCLHSYFNGLLSFCSCFTIYHGQ